MANSSIKIDASEVLGKLNGMDNVLQAQLKVVGSTISKNMEKYAKSNHPWKNRTYSAQNKLKGKYELDANSLDISVAHGVDYGYWLETRSSFNGRYQILEKARDSEVNNFKNMLQNMNLGG